MGQDFRNPYEQSKFEAELLVRERSRSLPIQVVRPSIVVGDSRTGLTPAFNVLYWPLRAFSKRHLSGPPGTTLGARRCRAGGLRRRRGARTRRP